MAVKLIGMPVDGRPVTGRELTSAQHRYDVFRTKHGSPFDALGKLGERLRTGGIKYWSGANKRTDQIAAVIAAFEALDRHDRKRMDGTVFRTLWGLLGEAGGEKIEEHLGGGKGKIAALEYALENDPGGRQALDRAMQIRHDEAAISARQKVEALEVILKYSAELGLERERKWIIREIEGMGNELMEAGKVLEKKGNYEGALDAYAAAARFYEAASDQHMAYKDVKSAASMETEKFVAVDAIMDMGDGMRKRVDTLVKEIARLGAELLENGEGMHEGSGNLLKDAERLAGEAASLENGADAGKRYADAENNYDLAEVLARELNRKAGRVLDIIADAERIAEFASLVYSKALSFYREAGITGGVSQAQRKMEEAEDRYHQLLDGEYVMQGVKEAGRKEVAV